MKLAVPSTVSNFTGFDSAWLASSTPVLADGLDELPVAVEDAVLAKAGEDVPLGHSLLLLPL